MTTDMSLLSLFTNASLLVQFVMFVLLLASVFSWTVILQRWQFLRISQSATNAFEHNFWSGIDLTKLYNKLSGQHKKIFGLDAIFVAGFREFVRLKKQNLQDPNAYVENVQRAMRISVVQEEARLERNLSYLATIQSMSPYIGLFGTVWGIMNSFRQLGMVQQATLSMVAPGISEALIATAMGLIAAIPAGIAYNRYISQIDSLSMKYRMFMEEFISIMQRRVSGGYEDTQDA
ncbi:MAG TPA: protein TolQ [Gammaproteobacteria bacterium]|nr:protein TolQ [Gammaproteobacteria bacterium]